MQEEYRHKIKSLIKAFGISQTQLADKMGVSGSHICIYLNETKNRPSMTFGMYARMFKAIYELTIEMATKAKKMQKALEKLDRMTYLYVQSECSKSDSDGVGNV